MGEKNPHLTQAMHVRHYVDTISSQSNVKVKIVLALPTYCFALCKIITVTKLVPLSDVCHHKSFEGLKLDVASVTPTT